MARELRVEYPGAICHVLNRGDRRKPIFRDNADRQRFVEAMLAQKQPRKLSGECDYRNRPLSDAQKASGSASSAELPARSEPMDRRESNRQKSRLRARIEHVFGYLGQSMKGFYLRYVSRRRNAAAIGLINPNCNLTRSEQIVRLKLRPRTAV